MRLLLRSLVACGVLVASSAVAALPPAEVGRLCVKREQQNGWLSWVRTELRVDTDIHINLVGGERVCLDLWVNSYSLQLEWKWDERDPDPRTYRSEPVNVTLKPGQVRNLQICANDGAPGDSGAPGWELAPEGRCPRR